MRKPKSFEKTFNGIQKMIMAEMLKKGLVEPVKRTLKSYGFEYSEELANMILAKYCKKYNEK